MTTADTRTSVPKASRGQLWLVVSMFFVPLGIAFLMYYGNVGWRPEGSTNKGELIDPARPLPEVSLPTPSGSPTAADFLRGKWSIVFVGDGACDEGCRKALTDIRQVRLALNQNSTRVQRVFLYSGPCCDEAYFSTEQAGLITASVDDAAGKSVLEVFPADNGVAALAAGRLYLVDPLGNLMMSYERGAPVKGLLDDLKKLLNLSHIG
jgi:cytochrome oxidase Cu insertion factor (SCO1/SenC/PrrC family)